MFISKYGAERIVKELVWYKGHTKINNDGKNVTIQHIYEDEVKNEWKVKCGDNEEAKRLRKDLKQKEQKIVRTMWW